MPRVLEEGVVVATAIEGDAWWRAAALLAGDVGRVEAEGDPVAAGCVVGEGVGCVLTVKECDEGRRLVSERSVDGYLGLEVGLGARVHVVFGDVERRQPADATW